MATATEIAALTRAHQAAQARRAALVAALVATWWRTRVDVSRPETVERWLQMMVPRVLAEHERSTTMGLEFYSRLRRLEVPRAPAFDPERGSARLNADQVRTSLAVVGPVAVSKKLAAWDKMTDPAIRKELGASSETPLEREMLVDAAVKEAAETIRAATFRHAANGGRQTIIDNSLRDRTAQGWIRVTRDDPCFFCVMLASRGPVFEGDSFDASDPRFHGPGDAKVHDGCGCSIKAVYTREGDPFVDRSKEFEALWLELSKGSGAEARRTFRNAYNARQRAA